MPSPDTATGGPIAIVLCRTRHCLFQESCDDGEAIVLDWIVPPLQVWFWDLVFRTVLD